jgi:integrase
MVIDNMASIEKRADNTYRITVSCGYDINGKKIRKYKTVELPDGMTERQLEKELNRQAVLFEEQVSTGQFLDGSIKLQEFAEIWMKEYSEKQHKGRNVASNRELLVRINEVLGHIRLCKLQPHHILEFHSMLAEPGQNKKTGSGLSPKTILNYHRLLSSILTTAVQWSVLPDNPAKRVKPPKVKRQEAKSLDDEQTMRLLAAIQDEPMKYRIAVETLLFLGSRRGELLGLTWSDINFESCTVNIDKAILYLAKKGIYQDTPKNESSNRVVKLPASVIRNLKAYRAMQNEEILKLGELWKGAGHIFTQWDGLPMHPDTLTQWFNGFIKRCNEEVNNRAGLSEKQREALRFPAISPHSLRHTNASLLIASGANLRTVAARLGHAQTSTTGNIYAHAIKTADALASDSLEDRLLTRPHNQVNLKRVL